jgi:CRISPR-associated endoribonuclease Cas6
MQHHYHIQGLIYRLLEGSKYHHIHNKEGYKFFCFSNIFPVTQILKKGNFRTLIISSPDEEFISFLYAQLQQPSNIQIAVGPMKFEIDSLDKMTVDIINPILMNKFLINHLNILTRKAHKIVSNDLQIIQGDWCAECNADRKYNNSVSFKGHEEFVMHLDVVITKIIEIVEELLEPQCHNFDSLDINTT